MPLTRHLYREDEVLAAMQLCILRGRVKESAFWCQELLDSGMADPLLAALKQLWLLGFGVAALRWYVLYRDLASAEGLDPEATLRLVVGLARIAYAGGRDTSFLALHYCDGPPDRVNATKVPRDFLTAAILQGRAATAWLIWNKEPEALLGAAEVKHGLVGTEVLNAIDEPAIQLAALCLPVAELKKRWLAAAAAPDIPTEVAAAHATWVAATGRRARRAYTIPPDCLYWLTARGNTTVYESNEKELRGSLERPGKLWGSAYWDDVAEEYGGWVGIREDPDQREAFYRDNFPDDIPDEWSAADRRVSHGNGSLQPGGEASATRFLRIWLGSAPTAVVWNGFEKGLRCVDAAAKTLEEIIEARATQTPLLQYETRPVKARRLQPVAVVP
jgi:hypothetical protein